MARFARYEQNEIDFYFAFEDFHGKLTRNACVNIVKDQYPSLFPATFSEALVRLWLKNGKKSDKSSGPGKDWRKGKTIIPTEVLVVLGSLIMAQYAAGVSLTATLLVPLVAGALAANGFGDVITLQPKPLAQAASHDSTLHISSRWVREFCRSTLKMSFRRPTRSSNHAHDDATLKAVGHIFLLRLAFIVEKFSVPKELVVNMDETGVFLMPLRTRGWAPKGSKQVVFKGKNDKRQFTVIPSITAAGEFLLPLMLLWAGKSDACHPSSSVQKEHEQEIRHGHSESHWSTVETMKIYVKGLVDNYLEPMREKLKLPDDQTFILILDVYSAHRDASFQSWVKTHYPQLILLFVPASFTPYLQPLDVAVNSTFKGYISDFCSQWFAQKVAQQLLDGKHGSNVEMDLTLKGLKQPFCHFLSEALKKMAKNKKELSRAWVETGLLDAWGPQRIELFDEAMELEEEGKLFGGVATKITIGGAVPGDVSTSAAADSSAAAAKGKAKSKAKPKAKPAAKTTAPSFVGPYGCSKCRYSSGGCIACNADKKAKWLEKKTLAEEAEQEEFAQSDAKIAEAEPAWEAHEEAEGIVDATLQADIHEDDDQSGDAFHSEGALSSDAKAILDVAFASCHPEAKVS